MCHLGEAAIRGMCKEEVVMCNLGETASRGMCRVEVVICLSPWRDCL